MSRASFSSLALRPLKRGGAVLELLGQAAEEAQVVGQMFVAAQNRPGLPRRSADAGDGLEAGDRLDQFGTVLVHFGRLAAAQGVEALDQLVQAQVFHRAAGTNGVDGQLQAVQGQQYGFADQVGEFQLPFPQAGEDGLNGVGDAHRQVQLAQGGIALDGVHGAEEVGQYGPVLRGILQPADVSLDGWDVVPQGIHEVLENLRVRDQRVQCLDVAHALSPPLVCWYQFNPGSSAHQGKVRLMAYPQFLMCIKMAVHLKMDNNRTFYMD